MNRLGINLGIFVLLTSVLFMTNARADDGVVRLRAVQGSFLVTIFTAPELLQDSPADINVLVQDQESSDPILDADVNLTFSPPGMSIAATNDPICGGMNMAGLGTNSEPFTVAASHGNSRNKLFYSAPVNFAAIGDWRMQISIKHDGAAWQVACKLPVSPAPHELVGLIPYLCLPPLMVGLFMLNHRLRTRLRGTKPAVDLLLPKPTMSRLRHIVAPSTD